jgi:hypothetical protein
MTMTIRFLIIGGVMGALWGYSNWQISKLMGKPTKLFSEFALMTILIETFWGAFIGFMCSTLI